MQEVVEDHFDAILTDPIFMCGTILAHHLSLPFVFFMRGFGCNLHFSAPQSPSPLSYVPRLFSFNSDRMTFFQRVENALISLLELDYCNSYYAEALKLSSEVLQRDMSLTDLVSPAAIWIMRFDFVFEYVRPVMPNMVFIGGLNCAKEKPLPKVMFFSDSICTFPHEKSLPYWNVKYKCNVEMAINNLTVVDLEKDWNAELR
uniref:Uncharacterized protein n=1 Tax=Ficedula albicollis TaxID=59894 RepID=A0A803VLQ7_FICAL